MYQQDPNFSLNQVLTPELAAGLRFVTPDLVHPKWGMEFLKASMKWHKECYDILTLDEIPTAGITHNMGVLNHSDARYLLLVAYRL